MPADSDTRTRGRVWGNRTWWGACVILTGLAAGLAYLELRRVATGHFQLFALPFDAALSLDEQLDAQRTARQFLWPAVLVTLVVGVVTGIVLRRLFAQDNGGRNRHAWILPVIVFAAIADAGTTLWFFHQGGIDLEVHPAIRLFGYAYGRTVGPLLAKFLQLAGIVLVCRAFPRWAPILAGVFTAMCLLAAAHNLRLSLGN